MYKFLKCQIVKYTTHGKEHNEFGLDNIVTIGGPFDTVGLLNNNFFTTKIINIVETTQEHIRLYFLNFQGFSA